MLHNQDIKDWSKIVSNHFPLSFLVVFLRQIPTCLLKIQRVAPTQQISKKDINA